MSRSVAAGLAVCLAMVPEAVAFSFVAGVSPLVGLWTTVALGFVAAALGGRAGSCNSRMLLYVDRMGGGSKRSSDFIRQVWRRDSVCQALTVALLLFEVLGVPCYLCCFQPVRTYGLEDTIHTFHFAKSLVSQRCSSTPLAPPSRWIRAWTAQAS